MPTQVPNSAKRGVNIGRHLPTRKSNRSRSNRSKNRPSGTAPVSANLPSLLASHVTIPFYQIAEKDVPAGGRSLIFVGDTAKAPKKDYKFDEILIKIDGGNLILAGHEKRGCPYAVYSFLQDAVGVRWWTPEDTLIPKKPTLVVADDLAVSYAPQMISREMYHRSAQPTVFSARMKGNGFLTPEYGGAVRIINFVHSFYKYLPPEKYFEAHPDWYSEIDGKRKHEHAQLCLTNEDMTRELIKNVLEALRNFPTCSSSRWRISTPASRPRRSSRATTF